MTGGGSATGGGTSASGISKVLAGEYLTFFLSNGRLSGVAGTWYRLGAGNNPSPGQFPPHQVAFPTGTTIVDGAGGLHFAVAVDTNGNVWVWGDIDWNPALAQSNVPTQLFNSKNTPFSLKDNAGHNVRSIVCSATTTAAVKGDGTVWVWDDIRGGLPGDGTAGTPTNHPVQVPFSLPTGVTITKLAFISVANGNDTLVALASNGTVWTWGGGAASENLGTQSTDYSHPHQITTTGTNAAMPTVTDIAGGGNFGLALASNGTLYAWGIYMGYAQYCVGNAWCPQARPVSMNAVTSTATASGATIRNIYTSSGANYLIMSNGQLWAWGTNGNGLVGNGVEPDYAHTTPPYAWDWSPNLLPVSQAVRIAPTVSNFTEVFSGIADVFYAYALTADGRLFSWGRNKTACLGNGIVPMNSGQAATWPNSWDVTTPTEVHPLTETDHPTSSPHCINTPSDTTCWCNGNMNGPQGC